MSDKLSEKNGEWANTKKFLAFFSPWKLRMSYYADSPVMDGQQVPADSRDVGRREHGGPVSASRNRKQNDSFH